MAKIRDHAGPSDPFETLVRAGADPVQLDFLCKCARAGARVKQHGQHGAKERKRPAELSRADESRWRRFPGRLREMARHVDEYISNPAFDPRRLLPKPEAKLTLRERMEPQQGDVRTLTSRIVNLPKTLLEFAAYLDICLRQGTAKLSVGTKTGDTLSRAVIILIDYVEKATHNPRYQTVADLVNKTLQMQADEPVGPDDLRKLRERNPRLRKSPKLFQV